MPADEAHPAEVVVSRRPDANGKSGSLESIGDSIRKLRLEMDEVAYGMEARAIHGIAGAKAIVKYARQNLDERAAEPSAPRGADHDR